MRGFLMVIEIQEKFFFHSGKALITFQYHHEKRINI